MRGHIPVVNMEDAAASAQLDAALASFGFVQLIGHGIALDRVADLWHGMDSLFALSDDDKLSFVVDDPLANRGFRRRGSEALAYSLGRDSPPDLFESFNLGHDNRADADEPLLALTPWPDAPGFRQSASRWLEAMANLCERLDAVLGPLAGVERLAESSRRGPDTMACINYQRLSDEGDPVPEQMRMGAHSDYTLYSILCADPVPGLEILGPDGDWLPITPAPGALLVNVGDLLAIATDDRWKSTLHRVPIPAAGSAGAHRRSVAYFHYPDLDVTIGPPPGGRYKSVTVRDHLTTRLVGPKLHLPSADGATTAGRLPT